MGLVEWYLVGANVIALVLMGMDKRRAIEGRWRIPERVLFGISFMGGSVGCICGMSVFRHKTKKQLFRIGLPVLFFVQFVLFILWKGYI